MLARECKGQLYELIRSGLLLTMWSHCQIQSGPPARKAHACVALTSAHALLRMKDSFLATYTWKEPLPAQNLFSPDNIYIVIRKRVMRIIKFID